MATLCSVKADGAARRSPPQLEVTLCDFKFSNSPGLSWNMKSGGNCGHLRRLPRYHAHVCRTDSLSADDVPCERCANGDCAGLLELDAVDIKHCISKYLSGGEGGIR